MWRCPDAWLLIIETAYCSNTLTEKREALRKGCFASIFGYTHIAYDSITVKVFPENAPIGQDGGIHHTTLQSCKESSDEVVVICVQSMQGPRMIRIMGLIAFLLLQSRLSTAVSKRTFAMPSTTPPRFQQCESILASGTSPAVALSG